jgi:hypothetical protein
MNLYLVENKATRRRFIAMTAANISRYRHRLHCDARRLKRIDEGLLLGDIARHGIENVTIQLIETCDDAIAFDRREVWIDYFGTLRPAGYNREKQEVGA